MATIETPLLEGIGLEAPIKYARGDYSFAADGGAISTIALTGSTAIPSGAIILGGFLEVTTALTSGGGATVAVQVNSANDLVTATAFGSAPWSSTGIKSLVPVFTGATMIKTTAARDISIVIAAGTLTGGVFKVVVLYIDPMTP